MLIFKTYKLRNVDDVEQESSCFFLVPVAMKFNFCAVHQFVNFEKDYSLNNEVYSQTCNNIVFIDKALRPYKIDSGSFTR
jgi:hypothetical protein